MKQVMGVIDVEISGHTTRAMMDGQIHDVEALAATILQIKNALEERPGNNIENQCCSSSRTRPLKNLAGSCYKSGNNLGTEYG